MAPLKQKGDLAELKVAADLAGRGCSISLPFGEDCDYDLVADLDGWIAGFKSSTPSPMGGSSTCDASRTP
jgi:PD-(D/E)XK nuclease superfamily protein